MDTYEAIINEIKHASYIVITSHRSPDGDSIGSSLGLYHFIKKLGKEVHICHPDPAPEFIRWVEGIEHVLTMTDHSISSGGAF